MSRSLSTYVKLITAHGLDTEAQMPHIKEQAVGHDASCMWTQIHHKGNIILLRPPDIHCADRTQLPTPRTSSTPIHAGIPKDRHFFTVSTLCQPDHTTQKKKTASQVLRPALTLVSMHATICSGENTFVSSSYDTSIPTPPVSGCLLIPRGSKQTRVSPVTEKCDRKIGGGMGEFFIIKVYRERIMPFFVALTALRVDLL